MGRALISLRKKHEISYIEAIKLLAEKYGLPIEQSIKPIIKRLVVPTTLKY